MEAIRRNSSNAVGTQRLLVVWLTTKARPKKVAFERDDELEHEIVCKENTAELMFVDYVEDGDYDNDYVELILW